MKITGTKSKELWISGINPVREALRSETQTPDELLLARNDQRAREMEELAAARGIPVHRATREQLSATAGHDHHQGAALRLNDFPYAELESLLQCPAPERDPLLALDSIQDPQNLGAILRSACFLGAKGVIIPKDRSAPVSAAVMKIAAGATSYIQVARITNLSRALKSLKQAGYWIVGLDVGGGETLYEADLTVPVCLVVGNEQKGIRPLVKSECDILVQIPATGPLQSLNAATAAAIALAEIQRQRLKARG
ncbi:MAG: 23S rRNA (guanosine(2251)-2'-O)-methyltransferase RlmB [Syntrophobacteraceae bacterium]